MVIAGTIYTLVYLSLSVSLALPFLLPQSVLAIMTAIHIEFLYSLKVMKMRHWKANNWEVAVHQEKKNPLGKVEVGVIGSAGELRRKKHRAGQMHFWD